MTLSSTVCICQCNNIDGTTASRRTNTSLLCCQKSLIRVSLCVTSPPYIMPMGQVNGSGSVILCFSSLAWVSLCHLCPQMLFADKNWKWDGRLQIHPPQGLTSLLSAVVNSHNLTYNSLSYSSKQFDLLPDHLIMTKVFSAWMPLTQDFLFCYLHLPNKSLKTVALKIPEYQQFKKKKPPKLKVTLSSYKLKKLHLLYWSLRSFHYFHLWTQLQ